MLVDPAPPLDSGTVFCIIPVRNRIGYTRACAEKLIAQDYPYVYVVFVDDGSTDGTFEYLNGHNNERITVLKGDGSLWWAGAMRLGIAWVLERAKRNDYILMLNDDTDFLTSFVSTLVEECNSLNRAVVGARHVARDTGCVLGSGFRIDYLKTFMSPVIPGSLITDVDALPGRGTLYPISAVVQAGNINASLFKHYLSDIEYSARMRELGNRVVISAHAVLSTDEKRSDESTISVGILSRKLAFKSKDNMWHKVLFFSWRGPKWLRPLALPRYGLYWLLRVVARRG